MGLRSQLKHFPSSVILSFSILFAFLCVFIWNQLYYLQVWNLKILHLTCSKLKIWALWHGKKKDNKAGFVPTLDEWSWHVSAASSRFIRSFADSSVWLCVDWVLRGCMNSRYGNMWESLSLRVTMTERGLVSGYLSLRGFVITKLITEVWPLTV